MDNEQFPKFDRLIIPSLFIFSFIFFLVGLSPVAFPGEPAKYLAAFLGLDPFPPLTHIVWGWLVRLVGSLSLFSPPVLVNLLSALCGAIAVTLMYSITKKVVELRFPSDVLKPIIPVLSGLVAAVYLMTVTPFWIAATRSYPDTFDVMLLLLAIHLLLKFGQSGQFRYAGWAVFTYSLGLTEFPTLLAMAPLFGFLLLYYLIVRGFLKTRFIVKLIGCFAVGLLPYFIRALEFMQTPAYIWRDFDHYFQVVWFMWRDQYLTLTQSLPKVGWLTVLIVSVVPWFIVISLAVPARSVNARSVRMGTSVLYTVLGVLSAFILFNTILSPWQISKTNPLLVTPYLFVAMWTGMIAGYGYIVLSRRRLMETPATEKIRALIKSLYIPFLAVVFAVAGVRAWPLTNGKAGALAARFADEVVDSLEGRTWLISNGFFDDNIVIAAHARGIDLKMINLSRARSEAYLRYVATLFDDSRLKSLALVGMGPLLNEWFTQHSGVITNVAILSNADIWFSAGVQPVPNKILFLGKESEGVSLTSDLLHQHKLFWSDLGIALQQEVAKKTLADPWNRWALTHVSKVANNLGVYCEEHNDAASAMKSYEVARALEPNNISAFINMHALAKRAEWPVFEKLDKELEEFIKENKPRYRFWSLAYHYGYIRSPETYAGRGMAWAISGKPNLAINDLKQALELNKNNQGVQLALANVYFNQAMPEQSAKEYQNILEKDPNNMSALLGMARLAAQRTDYDEARSYLGRLEELKAPEVTIQIEKAMLEAFSGNLTLATELLSKVAKNNPNNVKAWTALAAVAAETNDEKTLQEALAKLETAKILSPSIRLSVARIALTRGDRLSARKHLDELLRMQPASIDALELLLRLDVVEVQKDLAEQHVERLLALDSRNAFANYILGSLQLHEHQYSVAENSFRTSLSVQTNAMVLNDLAWVLQRRGANDEAMKFAQEAVAMDEKNGSAWDTLGSIYMNKERFAEAESAFQKALALQPENPSILWNVAKLYEKKGQIQDALALADKLLGRPSELSPDLYGEVQDMVSKHRAKKL